MSAGEIIVGAYGVLFAVLWIVTAAVRAWKERGR